MANSPYIPIAATSDDQAEDTLWGCFVSIAAESPNLNHLRVRDRLVTNPINYGEAKIVTSSSARNDGGKPTATGLDEAHLMHGRELLDLGKTMERNLAKRNIGDPQMFIATTMFMVGQGSYAEHLWDRADKDNTILYDHRQASDHWNTDDDSELMAALKESAGDAIAWLNVRQMMSSYRADPNEGERYWLNRYGGGGNAKLVNIQSLRACPRAEPLAPFDIVTVGVDGSMYNDNSGIVVCRLSDLSLHYMWHYSPDGTEGDAMAMALEMDTKIKDLMDNLVVTRLYADPPYITEYISAWSNRATQSKQRGMKPQIVQWWTNRDNQMANATREFVTVVNQEKQPHDHSEMLMEHIANAYKKEVRSSIEVDGQLMPGYVPRKNNPKSPKKIDLAVCAILARQAAIDSLAAGEDKKVRKPASGMVSF
jgi:phage terminase large subunit-like protein